MSGSIRSGWLAHWGITGTTLAVGLVGAFALGIDNPHGLFSTGFFLVALALFWSVYAVVTTLLVWKWGHSLKRALGIHALVLVGFPASFGIVASIVA
jgi:hypothetical protein